MLVGKHQPNLPFFTEDCHQLPITNKWWTSLLWKVANDHSTKIFALPLVFEFKEIGVRVGALGKPSVDNGIYSFDSSMDISISLFGIRNFASTRVKRYSDWSVTASSDEKLLCTMTKGCPFAFFEKKEETAFSIASFKHRLTILKKGNDHLVLSVNDINYGIFFHPTSKMVMSFPQMIVIDTPDDFLSFCVLPSDYESCFDDFYRRAFAKVVDTQVKWRYHDRKSMIVSTYEVETSLKTNSSGFVNETIQCLFPHHYLCNQELSLTNYFFNSPRGEMKCLLGNSFVTFVEFNGILPVIPHVGLHRHIFDFVHDSYQSYLTSDLMPDNIDSYWGGKPLLRVAQLVEVADQIGHVNARDFLLSKLEGALEVWFRGRGAQKFVYDETWKTLIALPSSFGSENCNDHHFHYGYFLQACATIARFDREWALTWKDSIEMMIRDVACWDRSDSMFPFMRCFDIFEGHNWENGNQVNGAQFEESSSEAMNFATGVFLWGSLIGSDEIRNLGLYLYSTQRVAFEQYWLDLNSKNFPRTFAKPMVGQVWGDSGIYATWWNGTPREIHGVNFFPIHRGSLYIARHPDHLKYNLKMMDSAQEDKTMWNETIAMTWAMAEPEKAVDILEKEELTYGGSESKAFTYHWIQNLALLGRLDISVLCNYPEYQVFRRGSEKTYVMFNPTSTERTYRFTDGSIFTIKPGEYRTEGTDIIKPLEMKTLMRMKKTDSPLSTKVYHSILKNNSDDFDLEVFEDISSKVVRFELTTDKKMVYVDLYATIGLRSFHSKMEQSERCWVYEIGELVKGDIIRFSFVYLIDGSIATLSTSVEKYVFLH